MIARAKLRFIRISPKKARDVVNLIRGKHVREAQDILTALNKRISRAIKGLLNSAISNAKQANQDTDNIYISKIMVDGGPFLKRFRAESFGKASQIHRKLSHIELEIDRISPKKEEIKSTSKKKKIKKPQAKTQAKKKAKKQKTSKKTTKNKKKEK